MILATREGRTTGAEGMELAWRLWEVEASRASVLIVHGLGEHSGRYRSVAEVLSDSGISVFAFDLRGHGLSEGPRGDVSAFPRFLEDLLVMEEVLDRELPGSFPRFLLGHSLGGLIALERLRTLGEGYAGAILSAPWIRAAQSRWLRTLGRRIGWLFPRAPMPNGIGPGRLTRDPVVAEAWKRDPLIHTRLTGGLFREAERVQRELLKGGISTRIPTLFLIPGSDQVVDGRVTEEFARGIVEGAVRVEILEGRFHEPFNDLGREEVLETVATWLRGLLTAERVDSRREDDPLT